MGGIDDGDSVRQLKGVEVFSNDDLGNTFSKLSVSRSFVKLKKTAVHPIILKTKSAFEPSKNQLPIICNVCKPPLVRIFLHPEITYVFFPLA